ncbi:MAG: peptidylprolyl isomerase [Gammaproteobacteria bacterium]|nr:peptidylprolyl isomerase [Burkholderiaceae bacterium]MDH5175397.1 peptidylprolyl isomerase [Gammaproteobacteria bacterium]MDH5226109.1 peptidylprolyl isomerase [Gammaproteobacteria bacterium]
MRKFLREPLLHFLLIGIGLFVLYDVLRGGNTGAPREIVVTEARVEALAQNFATTWMRPPTAQEIGGLIDDYIAEEIYYREAIAMGLDQDDTVIRRRLRQKMEFISEDAAAAAAPTDVQLQEFLAKHPERFLEPAQLSFRQVYFSTEKRGEQARVQAEQLLTRLQAGRGPADPAAAGDPTLLPPDMHSASPQLIANTFGSDFAAQVAEAPVGQWSGPLQSGFGLHLVHVDERVASVLPAFDQIRPIVLREYQAEQRTRSNKKFLDGLRTKYEIRIEGPVARPLEQTGTSTGVQGGGAQ